MHMSQGGLDNLLKKFEGCKLKAYRCPANVCTIGYGHTSAAGAPMVNDGMTITQAQAEDILKRDIVKYEIAVMDLVKVKLTQNQFDVLTDFAYNAGVGNLKSSTMLKKINSGNLDAVPSELMKWTKGGGKVLPGLVRRRQAAGAWWTAGAAPVTPEQVFDHEQEHRLEPDAPSPQRTMADSKQGNAAVLTAGLGGLGIAKEVASQAQEASDTANQLAGLFANPNFLIMVAVVGLAAAIWFWRKKHMDEHGV